MKTSIWAVMDRNKKLQEVKEKKLESALPQMQEVVALHQQMDMSASISQPLVSLHLHLLEIYLLLQFVTQTLPLVILTYSVS
jgi:hypothetical protein